MTITSVSTTMPPAPMPEPGKAAATSTANAPGKTTTDHAVISPAGHAALTAEQAPASSTTSSAAALSAKALQLGKQLQHSNPVDFKKADTNGDGKLSAEEARAAGLM